MKSKTIDIVLVLLVVFIILAYFGIRQQVYSSYDLIKHLENTEKYIKDERWSEAIKSSHAVKDSWNNVKFWAMINYAEQDISAFEEYMSLLVGGTENNDSASALSSALHIKNLWNNMKRLVPQP